jgi:hypothetical protein
MLLNSNYFKIFFQICEINLSFKNQNTQNITVNAFPVMWMIIFFRVSYEIYLSLFFMISYEIHLILFSWFLVKYDVI